jgi:hypothetical protein
MRGIKMIKLVNFPILNSKMETLKETSKDNHGDVDIFMTESRLQVINFDAVKDEYGKDLFL